jgi:hypothetical protein
MAPLAQRGPAPALPPSSSHPPHAVAMTSTADARLRLCLLMAERLDAIDAGPAGNRTYLDDLDADITACREVYTLHALTDIASLRAELRGGPLAG